eukprot:scaffold1082_cov79-Cylindrotheca_fusiformis.AAC.4
MTVLQNSAVAFSELVGSLRRSGFSPSNSKFMRSVTSRSDPFHMKIGRSSFAMFQYIPCSDDVYCGVENLFQEGVVELFQFQSLGLNHNLLEFGLGVGNSSAGLRFQVSKCGSVTDGSGGLLQGESFTDGIRSSDIRDGSDDRETLFIDIVSQRFYERHKLKHRDCCVIWLLFASTTCTSIPTSSPWREEDLFGLEGTHYALNPKILFFNMRQATRPISSSMSITIGRCSMSTTSSETWRFLKPIKEPYLCLSDYAFIGQLIVDKWFPDNHIEVIARQPSRRIAARRPEGNHYQLRHRTLPSDHGDSNIIKTN